MNLYEEKYNEILEWARKNKARLNGVPIEEVLPELAESEDERIRRWLCDYFSSIDKAWIHKDITCIDILKWLEKQKENPKTADSIPSDCVSDAKCEDRWYKVTDSLPDNGRLVLAKDCLGNVLLARYDGENWEVNVYDNEDHYCHNSISKWCEIPSEKQKEQKPVDLSEMMVHKEPYIAPVPTPMVADEQKPAEWSEEDQKSLNRAINICISDFGEESETARFLKSLPGRFNLQPKTEWSEEDEKMLERAIHIIVEYSDIDEEESEIVQNWLKSLRPSWKPSEEELGRKHLEGYCMGREDTLREMKDFIESHFNCENAKKGTPIVYNTQSGTSTLKAER